MRADLQGQRFGMLIALHFSRRVPRGEHSSKIFWMAECDCGNEVEVSADNIRSGNTVSCGCQQGKRLAPSEKKCWRAMIARCYYPKSPRFESYSSRGIRVCEQWRMSFDSFLADMGPRPSARHSIERIDNEGNYEPSNCKWATHEEQRANRRDSRRVA